MKYPRAAAFALASVLLCTASPDAYANFKFQKDPEQPAKKIREEPVFSQKQPVLLIADKLEYDQNNDIVTATGHVEITQGDTVIVTDQLVYDQAQNTVNAAGNISMLTPSGDVYFADKLEFQDDLKAGVIHQVKMRLSDNSVLVANAAHRVSEDVTKLFRAAYTPCNCHDENGNNKSPLWSIKAKEATIDNEKQEVRYEDAQLALWDTPVIYSPYFSHSTPGAENESGLLTPSFLRSRNLGEVYKQPVYYSIAQDKDITLTPILTSKVGAVMEGNYRQKFDSGAMNFQGSITSSPNTDAAGNETYGHQVRGNYDAKGDFIIDQNFDWGFRAQRATDDTYLHLYNFSNETLLTSKIYAEGFNFVGDSDRMYASVQGLSFQGLTGQDNSKLIPVVAPLGFATWQSNPLEYNSRVTLEGNTMALYRVTGDESRRLSGTARWNLPYITANGQSIEFQAQLRTDVYSVSNVLLGNGTHYNGVTGREIPEVSVTWRYPLINRLQSSSITIEPVVNLTVSPGGGNPEKIPNEDSLLPEFTDANLFSSDRFAGYDRIENGPRMSYGIRGQAQLKSEQYVDFLVGQEYRVNNDPIFPISNDLTSHFSDYVGKMAFIYAPFNFGYRFRLDDSDFKPNRSEWDAGYNKNPYSINASYLSLHNDPILGNREVINGNGAINLTDEWSVTASSSRDLRNDQMVTAYGGLIYKNECITLTTVAGKDYINLLDIKPSLSFWFRVSLKNLE